jgi:hypothetical protein
MLDDEFECPNCQALTKRYTAKSKLQLLLKVIWSTLALSGGANANAQS